MQIIEPKPCPFCGSPRIGTHFKKSSRKRGHQSMCLNCRVGQTHSYYESAEASINAWNARSIDATGSEDAMQVSNESAIKDVLESLSSRIEAESLTLKQEELDSKWHFKFDPTNSNEWNLYQFSSQLESFKRVCRKWEETHNGSCCVVERVRDTYLMPKINQFLKDFKRE